MGSGIKIRWEKAEQVALRTASLYVAAASTYILLSDRLVAGLADAPAAFTHAQQFKGLAFVFVTGVLLFFMVRHQARSLIEAERQRADAHKEVIKRLAIAAEWRDDESGDHVRRVSEFATVIARNYGLAPDEVERIRLTSSLHDVGKIGVPDEIVMFDGAFDEEQRRKMQLHTVIGAQILACDDCDLLHTAQRIALAHHERWDGTGYPYRIKGEQIPIEARITSVADVFDALLSKRRYKEEWPWDAAVAEIVSNSGTQFDPGVVAAFERSISELREVWKHLDPRTGVEVGKRSRLAA